MIYVCVCDGEVIGFAGVYSDLISAGVADPFLNYSHYLWAYIDYGYSGATAFAKSFGALMPEVGKRHSGRIIFNPVHLSVDALDPEEV